MRFTISYGLVALLSAVLMYAGMGSFMAVWGIGDIPPAPPIGSYVRPQPAVPPQSLPAPTPGVSPTAAGAEAPLGDVTSSYATPPVISGSTGYTRAPQPGLAAVAPRLIPTRTYGGFMQAGAGVVALTLVCVGVALMVVSLLESLVGLMFGSRARVRGEVAAAYGASLAP